MSYPIKLYEYEEMITIFSEKSVKFYVYFNQDVTCFIILRLEANKSYFYCINDFIKFITEYPTKIFNHDVTSDIINILNIWVNNRKKAINDFLILNTNLTPLVIKEIIDLSCDIEELKEINISKNWYEYITFHMIA